MIKIMIKILLLIIININIHVQILHTTILCWLTFGMHFWFIIYFYWNLIILYL